MQNRHADLNNEENINNEEINNMTKILTRP